MKQLLPQHVKALNSLASTAHSGTTAQNGAAIDRLGYDSAIVLVYCGATSSDPSVATITPKIQQGAASNLSDAADVTLNTTIAAIDCTSAAFASYHVDLRGLKRYFRVVTTPAFTGGTTPAIAASHMVVLGDCNIEPAPSAVTVYAKST